MRIFVLLCILPLFPSAVIILCMFPGWWWSRKPVWFNDLQRFKVKTQTFWEGTWFIHC